MTLRKKWVILKTRCKQEVTKSRKFCSGSFQLSLEEALHLRYWEHLYPFCKVDFQSTGHRVLLFCNLLWLTISYIAHYITSITFTTCFNSFLRSFIQRTRLKIFFLWIILIMKSNHVLGIYSSLNCLFKKCCSAGMRYPEQTNSQVRISQCQGRIEGRMLAPT